MGSASDSGTNPSPVPSNAKDSDRKGSGSGSSTTSPTGGPVVPIPEQVVHGDGVKFNGPNGVELVLPSREALRLPGGFADPTRYLQTLPGVGNDSDFDGLLFVRGSESDQNRIFLDGVSVTDPYHFGGVVSFFNTDVIDRVEFVPGAYAAADGDALGGLLRVDRRIGNLSEVRGTASLSVTSANASVEGPLDHSGTSSFLFAARRSYLDQVLSGRTSGNAVLPSYYDLDSRLYKKLGNHQIRLGLLHSGDALSARLSDNFTFAPPDSGGMTWNRNLTMGTLNWDYASGPWKVTENAGYTWRDQDIILHGTLEQHATEAARDFDWHSDVSLAALGATWSAGTQIQHVHYLYDLDINRLTLEETDRRSAPRSPLDTVETVSTYTGRDWYQAGYLQSRMLLAHSTVDVTGGVRLEHSTTTQEFEPTPRLSALWRSPWHAELSFGMGSYRQFPGDRLEADPQIGGGDLKAERARHITAGIAWPLASGGRLSIEGYDKKMDNLLVYLANAPQGSPSFASTGSGVARGIETLAHLKGGRWSGWAAYTLGQVTYQDQPGSTPYAPAQDIRHIISLVGRYELSPGWAFGFKWRANSGRPYTPIVGREDVSEFVNGIEWIPVEGAYNSARFPWYHRLDVRAEHNFRVAGLRSSAFLEVINLYGRKNLYDYRYVDGFSRALPVNMLPFLPTFGLSVAI
jgi:hypothetical protein